MLARDLVLEIFREYGVEYLFGNPGTTELPLIDGLVNYPDIKFKVAFHEDICVGMAAGYAHVSRKPGVVNLHAAPGVAHGLGNIYDAYRAGIPLVVTAGQQDSRLTVQEPALAGDMVSMAKTCTKWCWEIKNATELPVVLHRAFKIAMTEPMGPVLISFPSDIMWHEIDAKPIPLTVIPKENRGDAKSICEAAQLLKEANNPVFVSGDRVGRTKGAMDQLVQLAELIGAKVYTEHHSSELNFPYSHKQYAGRFMPNGSAWEEALREADCVLFAGVMSQAPLLYFDRQIIQPYSKVIQIDSGDWELGKNMHIDVPIVGNPAVILQEIIENIKRESTEKDEKRFEENREKVYQMKQVRDKQLCKELYKVQSQVPLAPARVMHELNKYLPGNVIIVDEATTNSSYLHKYVSLDKSGSLIGLKGGGLGYGLPAAIGAQLADPNKRVVSVIGDGSSLYYIQALWNAAEDNLPIVFITVNNQGYLILKGGILKIDGESAKKNKFFGMDFDKNPVDFVSVAKGFGIEAIRATTPDELEMAFKQAFTESKPILLDIHVDRTVKVFLK